MTVSVVGCLSDIAAAMFCNKTQWIGLGGPLEKDGGATSKDWNASRRKSDWRKLGDGHGDARASVLERRVRA
eukprot:9487550-Pyramimonas_sp.AAC.1